MRVLASTWGLALATSRRRRSSAMAQRPVWVLKDRAWVLLLAIAVAGCAAPFRARRVESTLVLRAPDGQTVSLDELRRDRVATVLIFWSGGCPCVRRYQARIDDLSDRYPADRVRVLGVSSNAGECFSDVLKIARERGVRLPIYRDEDGSVARAAGARSTPTTAVIDADGVVRFLGWIDNERLPGDPGREPWLDRAIQGLLDKTNDFPSKTPVYGCAITRTLFGAGAPAGSCTTSNQEEKGP